MSALNGVTLLKTTLYVDLQYIIITVWLFGEHYCCCGGMFNGDAHNTLVHTHEYGN